MRRGILVGLLISLIAAPEVYARGCAVVVRRQAVVVEKKVVAAVVEKKAVVVEKAVAAVALAIPVLPIYTPSYGAVYYPPQQQQAPYQSGQTDELLRRVLERLERLERGQVLPPNWRDRERDPSLPGRYQMPPAGNGDAGAGAAPQTFVQHAQNKCASCHEGASAKGGFKMFDNGQLSQLTPEQLGDIIDAVGSKRMPRSGSMSDTERLQFISSMVKR